MSCENIVKFVDKEKNKLNEQNQSISTFQQLDSFSVVTSGIIGEAASKGAGKLTQSPLKQLGEDFVSEQIAKNGQQIMNNVTGQIESELNRIVGTPVRKAVDQAQSTVFNSISAALTAQNDLQFFFLQKLASNCIEALEKKIRIAREVKEKLRQLYNALIILRSGDPFFSEYLEDIREALRLIDDAQDQFRLVRNTFQATDNYLKRQFEQAVSKLEKAEDILSPDQQDPDISFADGGLLENVGIPSEPQQLSVILSIPKLVQDVLRTADEYFAANVEANALLLAFRDGLLNFQESASEKLKEYTLSMFDQLIDKTDNLADRMAVEVNGVAGRPQEPQRDGPVSGTVEGVNENEVLLRTDQGQKIAPRDQYQIPPQIGRELNFRPDSVAVSSKSLSWVFELRSIIEFASFIPGQTLEDLETSNEALEKYREAVECLKTKNGLSENDAVLDAEEGREKTGQFESQLSTFTLNAMEAIVSAEASEEILALGRTTITRMDLSIEFNQSVINCLQPFASADLALPDAVSRVGNSITDMLDSFGFDRATELLNSGSFQEFFNLNSKTATFAGAALAGISTLKECLSTDEEREKLNQAEREIQRAQKSKELLAERSATSGFETQKAQNKQEIDKLTKISEEACDAADKCGFLQDFKPTSLVEDIGSSLNLPLSAESPEDAVGAAATAAVQTGAGVL